MMDGTGDLYRSNYLLNAQYRGRNGNPDNCIAFKALLGDPALKLEPDFGARAAGVMALDPAHAYFWKGTWGNFFRLTVQDSINDGAIYDFKISVSDLGFAANAATYNLDGAHIAAFGYGVGGQLAALVGTTADDK